MVPAAIIPRMLGPADYGNFIFLIYIFTQIASIIGIGNNYLFTRLAENSNEHGIKSFYFNLIGTGFFLFFIFVAIISLMGIYNIIFPNQKLQYIWMTLFLLLCLSLSQVLAGMIDVYGLTVKGEIVNTLSSFSAMLFLIFIYWSTWQSLTAAFAFRYLGVLFLIVGLVYLLKKKSISIYPVKKNTIFETKTYLRQYLAYSMPLFMYSMIVLVVSSLQRWLLQIFGGSIQQGYFGISNQISAFVIIFSSALSPLLLREFSLAMGNNDMKKIADQFQRFIPMFYSMAAYFSVFIMFQIQIIVLIIGGRNYSAAVVPAAIMSLYPLFYTTNNIVYAVFYSTRNTMLLGKIGSIIMLGMLPIAFVLLAPEKFYGLNLAANGLAIMMVFGTFLSYNVYLWFSTRILSIPFRGLFFHQFYVVAIFGILALISINISNKLFVNSYVSFFLSGTLYTLGTFVLIALFPPIFRISMHDIMRHIKC